MTNPNVEQIKTYDIIIVGAGPIGCILALNLHAHKFRVLILEKKSWDTVNTPYLNGVSEHFFSLFDRLDILQFILQTKNNDGETIGITTPKGISLEEAMKEKKRIFFCRKEFDELLRKEILDKKIDQLDETQSIIPIKEENTVIGIQCVHKEKHLKFKCNLVVGCDGSHSKLAKSVDLPFKPLFHHLYQGRLYKNTQFANNQALLFPNPKYGQLLLVFSTNSQTNGHAYIEVETDLNHSQVEMTNYKESLEQSFNQILAQYPKVSEAMQGATPLEDWKLITMKGHHRSRLSLPGFLLLGDSACCVDPIGSSGLLLGLQGIEDFLSVVTAHQENNWNFVQWEKAYLQRVDELNRFIKLMRFMLKRPMILDLVLKILNQRPQHKKDFIEVFNGVKSYTQFLELGTQLKFWLSAFRS